MPETLEQNEQQIVSIPVNVEGADGGDNINITSSAAEAVKKIIEDNNVPEDYRLRLDARGGGCSGMQYVLGFDDKVTEEDRAFEAAGIKLTLSSRSLFYFMGITIDYIDGPQGSGFVFQSPDNMPTCGCQGH